MGYLAFFLLVGLTCLLWSAACTALAARVGRAWLRSLVLALGIAVPLVGLLPWLAATSSLAFDLGVRPNWFASTVTIVLSAVIGGIWISRAGMHADPGATVSPAAGRWPAVGLLALSILAHACAIGTLLILDNAVAAEARAMRVEAAVMMQAALPPVVPDADRAARLHGQAAAAIAAHPSLKSADGPLFRMRRPGDADAAMREVFAQHTATIETVRRAADIEGCRFRRDWTRPSVEMIIPEINSLRVEARLLSFAARMEAADGRHAEALADVARIANIGRHAASEPILIAQIVGWMIEADALDVLAKILPSLGSEDASLLESPAIGDLVAAPPTLAHCLIGEEAFGLATFADFADGRRGYDDLGDLLGDPGFSPFTSDGPFAIPASALSMLFRVFLLPADIEGYRRGFDGWRRLATVMEEQPQGWPNVAARLAAVEDDLRSRGPRGLLCRMIAQPIDEGFMTQTRVEALHRAAAVLVAATRHRLATGSLPATIDELVPSLLPAVPRDPFTASGSMNMLVSGKEVVVWSVGPDRESRGGDLTARDEEGRENDDTGMRMAVSPAPAAAGTAGER